ncbi:hypothetical protein KL928_001745 [Ogataea angusta]|uniref:Uncharacterized protein n=1 Tax=Pichia angusta TaxID=870730 RepID=A0AAN6DIS9_PICAN|nr:uncharacterized protein KL928_001745 [Ogataea angusta]KAG7820308.1 hypothetical protein KL928_001745 [Ogataea angusta]
MSKVGDSSKKFHVNSSGLLGAESLENLTSSLEKSFSASPRTSPSRPRRARKEAQASPSLGIHPQPQTPTVFSPAAYEISKKFGKFTEKFSFGSPRSAVSNSNNSPASQKNKSRPLQSTTVTSPRFQEPSKSPHIWSTPTSSQQSSPQSKRKNSIPDSCIFCDLPLQSMLLYKSENMDPEGIIELRCQHSCHEKCLLLEMEFVNISKVQSSASVAPVQFPHCPKCHQNVRAVPASQVVADQMITNILTVPVRKPEPAHSIHYRPPNSQPGSNGSSPRITQRNRADQWVHQRHAKKPSRGSSISAVSSIISSVSVQTVPESSSTTTLPLGSSRMKSSWTSDFPIYLLRSKFIGELIMLQSQKFDTVRLNKLAVDSFGDLRLVDKLQISEDLALWDECYCYLFERMFVLVDLCASTIKTFSVDHSLKSQIPSPTVVKVQFDSELLYLSCSEEEVLEKWGVALANLNTEFPSGLITTTVKEDEFYEILKFNETETPQQLPPGVNPKFYEATINSLVFSRKPCAMIIVINQLNPSHHSLVSIKNIVRSLLMVKIQIHMVFTSSLQLRSESQVLSTLSFDSGADDDEKENLFSKIDEYHKLLNDVTPTADENRVHWGTDDTLCATLQNFRDKCPHSELEDLATVVLSVTPLSELSRLPTSKNIFVEISTPPNLNGSHRRSSVFNVTGWEDAMEAICSYTGLEFDDSDFEDTSDESDDDERPKPTGIGVDFSSNQAKDGPRWSTLLKDLDKALEETKKHTSR